MPRQAPPPPKAETRGPRRKGSFWVEGHWDWKGNQYVWVKGRWERERQDKKRFRAPRWEQRGDQWVKVEGEWTEYTPKPANTAPPPPKVEKAGTRPGHVWVAGHWDWDDDEWVWVAGRHERVRQGQRWREPKWEQKAGVWVKVGGDWEAAPAYPTEAPPSPREERQANRAGFVWMKGHWEWKNGNWEWAAGKWERERANNRWNEGRWEKQGDRYVWIDGKWEPVPVAPGAFDNRGWKKVIERNVNQWDEVMNVAIGERQHGRVNNITIFASDGQFDVLDAVLTTTTGKVFRMPRTRFVEGSRSQTAFLGEGEQLRSIYYHVKKLNGERGHIEFWARQGLATGQTAAPLAAMWDPGTTWKRIVERGVNQNTDSITLEIGERQHGRVNNVTIVVPDNDLEFQEIVLTTVSGKQMRLDNTTLGEGTRSKTAWLGENEVLRRISYKVKKLHPGSGRVEFWARTGLAPNQAPTVVPSTAPPPPTAPTAPPIGAAPTQAPPPPQVEKIETRDGYVWARGHYEWKNGRYEWQGGHWERSRAKMTWQDARWELRGNTWVFIPGSWR